MSFCIGWVGGYRGTRSFNKVAGTRRIRETKWKGSRAREGNGYKLWYSGFSTARNGIGVIVAGRLKDDVVRVTRRSNRIRAISVVIDGESVNVISTYAPQVGLSDAEKKSRIGAASDGYEGLHGGFGFRDRNEEGRTILEFDTTHDLVIGNRGCTFQEEATQEVGDREAEDTMEELERGGDQMWNTFASIIRDVAKDSLGVASELARTHSTHKESWWFSREKKRQDIGNVRYIKDEGGRTIVREEEIRKRWKEYFSSLFNESPHIVRRPERSGEVRSSRHQMNYDCYYSRINQREVRAALQRMGINKSVGPDQIPIEAWRCLEDDGEAQTKVAMKQSRFKELLSCRDGNQEDVDLAKERYQVANREAKIVVARAKDKSYEDLYLKLDSNEGANDIYKIAKAREKKRQDIGNVRYIKDEGGRTIVREEEIRKRWKEYFSSLFNESPHIVRRPERSGEVRSSRHQMNYDCYYSRINQREVRAALQRMGI
nr:craniofacial development protein 2-like [Tanacetum cinerariifolium]